MSSLTNRKSVVDEITLDDEEEDEEMKMNENYSEDTETKDFQVSLTNEFRIEQGRGDSDSYHYENGENEDDEDDNMDYDEISQVNQPVDFIFAVEDDDGVEAEFDTQQIFSNELKDDSIVKPDDTPLLKDLLKQKTPPPKQDQQPIRTRSALRQQSVSQNGHSVPTSTSTPNIHNKQQPKKLKAPETVDSLPVKQLRSSIRETRSVQNKSTTQPTPNEPKSGAKKAVSQPVNTKNNTSTQPTTSEPKSANKKVTNNLTVNQATPNGGPTTSGTKNGKKSVNGANKGATVGPNTNRTGITTNGTPAIKAKLNVKTVTAPSVATITNDKTGLPKKRVRTYWSGKEHNKLLGPDAPFVMLDRLSLFYSGDTEYKGHDCFKTPCPAKRSHSKRKPPVPPPRIEPLTVVDNLSSTINSVASDLSIKMDHNPDVPPGRPQIGQNIRFQFWQTPLGNNVPAKSCYQKAKITGYDDEFDLYEIELYHYDHPFVITKDKSKNQRVTTNTMVIDWNSLADPSII